ncbi:4-hydroxythreonine-4-phosphate dehydrogenase [Tenacibaculum holothuriorum]|uniref:4-hydroxythreonine-4-phosphate dehydrogenase n=1 Tax=Tenacibaculum holothuriorum TaxID=1635173 RepID=A0A1Y2PFQ5_9FLAO|nr:4-hydroxythreonine-4-phosphate dehydrogenase PdxA [Tenacibaculum holothuriorum]OSY88637.1 4-hydroxythreonine-4-phosphate dehydrogenase [Tenacibaculum holothuriorum]
MEKTDKIIVGISVGDINGIGIEIILKTFEDKRMLDFCTPVIFASNRLISFHKKNLKLNNSIHSIHSTDKITHGKINLVNIWKEEVKIEVGKSTGNGGKYAFKSLEAATKALKNNHVDILLTAPINKDTIQSEDFKFPGHTEYLQDNLDGKSLMILMTDELRVGLITGHIPVSKVSETITPELIQEKVEIMHKSLVEDFAISKPKIAILGLNPHCGDNGIIGSEDNEIVRPTITEIKKTGKMVFGPYAADGFFGSKTYKQFDGVLAMYHDQGLAPFKALSFGNGVNYTAGLNKVRTSPDHGTGFDIAGKNKANPDSFKEALFTSLHIYKNRNEYQELTKNKLPVK